MTPSLSNQLKAKRPHVALVRGPIVYLTGSINQEATPALAFAHLSAYLHKQGVATTWIDAIGEGLNQTWPWAKRTGFWCHGLKFEDILERIPIEAEIIGFSGMFSGEWPVLRELIREVRRKLPRALLVAGGEHATALSEFTLRDCPELDVIVRGEGEHTFYELIEAYRESGRYDQVDGISFLNDNGDYCENGGLPRIHDASDVPWPFWPEGYLEKFWALGKSYGPGTWRDMPFMASRGCPYRCTFCSNPQMWTTRYVLRDPDDCIAEIQHYIERFKITSLQFYDLTAITKRGWVIEFCKKLIEKDIRLAWSLPSGTRSEVLDAEVLELMHRAGCRYLVYAPESGSPETLKNIKKMIKLDNLVSSVRNACGLGMSVRTNLIIGFPCESRWNVFETIRFGVRMSYWGVGDVPIFMFSPYPGSEIFRELRASGRLAVNDDYFFNLTSINGNFMSSLTLSCNPHMPPWELAIYRSASILLTYGLSYLCYPSRVVRTLKNLRRHESHTVLEHRLQDVFQRWFATTPPS